MQFIEIYSFFYGQSVLTELNSYENITPSNCFNILYKIYRTNFFFIEVTFYEIMRITSK